MPDTILPGLLDSGPKKGASLALRDILRLPALAGARVVAGEAGLDRPVLWSHVVDMPDPSPWVPAGYFLLTTGYSWPREAAEQRGLIEALAVGGIAGVGLAVPRYVQSFSQTERETADRVFLPPRRDSVSKSGCSRTNAKKSCTARSWRNRIASSSAPNRSITR